MLIVCNGSMKSGSTWIMQIVASHGKWAPIPDEYRNPKWFNPSICSTKYADFFNAREYPSNDWFCKQHWRGHEKFSKLLLDDQVKLLNIVRDLRDVVVSMYFHDHRLGNTSAENVQDFYFEDGGREKMRGYIEYHRFWHDPILERQPYLCVYENLISDFDHEIKKMFEFLGQPLSQDEVDRIREKTSFKNKKKTGEGTFYRKGQVGDWVNHLSTKLTDDLESMMLANHYPHQRLQHSFSNS